MKRIYFFITVESKNEVGVISIILFKILDEILGSHKIRQNRLTKMNPHFKN